MGAVTTALAVGSAVAGTFFSIKGQQQLQQGQRREQQARKKQMNLDRRRRLREIIRERQQARALALSRSAAQTGGGMALESSGVQGGLAQTTSQAARRGVATEQNADIGTDIFGARAQQAEGRGMAAFGGELQSAGTTFLSNLETFNRVGRSAEQTLFGNNTFL